MIIAVILDRSMVYFGVMLKQNNIKLSFRFKEEKSSQTFKFQSWRRKSNQRCK